MWVSYGLPVAMLPVGVVAVAAELSQAVWQAFLSPTDRLVEKCQPAGFLLMMSSVLISQWAEIQTK